jgi:hypothetical protein
MSERFLEGYAIAPKAFDALIGTPKLAAKTVRKKLGRAAVVRDLEMTLAQSWDGEDAAEGAAMVDGALAVLAKGRPAAKHDAYELTRVTALILAAYGKKLGTIELVPYVAGDDFGLMNPVLKALGLATMAKEYGQSSFAFPYKKRTKATEVGWPIMTHVDASLAAWKRELATDWAKRLPGLPAKPFTDKRYGTDDDEIAMTKQELAGALGTLKKWVDKVAKQKGGALVLVLDGDQ